jgi:probable phosphoglycerate mutase
MSELLVLRHAETVWHAENRYAGRTDIALTEQGVFQAEELGKWSVGADLSAVWCSPLIRARETAAPVGRAAGLQLVVDERLTELDFGAGEGLTAAEMAGVLGDARERFVRDPVAHYLPGGEDPAAAARRAVSALVEAAETAPRERVMVVAHSSLLRLALCEVLGVPLRRYRALFPEIGNCRGARLRYRDGEFALLGLNEPLVPDGSRAGR